MFSKLSSEGKNKAELVSFIFKSDFLDNNHWVSLRIANRKHDLIGIRLYDPAELDIPDFGLAKIEDPETGSMFWVDTSSFAARQELQKKIIDQIDELKKKAISIGFDLISIATDQDFVEPLRAFFKLREERY